MKKLTIIGFQHKETDLERAGFVKKLLIEQTSQDFKVLIVKEIEGLKKETISNVKGYYTIIKKDFVGDWGQTSKYKACKKVITEYVCFPNVDSSYNPLFVEKMLLKANESNADLVYCDMNTPSKVVVTPKKCGIDVGGFIVKREVVLADGWTNRSSIGDGLLVERIVSKGYKVVKVDEDLYNKR